MDRYTISITAKYVGQDLGFGDLDCMPNISVIKEYHLSRKFYVDTLMVECNKNSTMWVLWYTNVNVKFSLEWPDVQEKLGNCYGSSVYAGILIITTYTKGDVALFFTSHITK